jgi:hypothetical protein
VVEKCFLWHKNRRYKYIGIEKTAKDGKVPNVGAGPIKSDLMRTVTWRSKAKYRA